MPSDELFQFWSERLAEQPVGVAMALVETIGLALHGRRLWEAMSFHWPAADQQPGATPAHIEYARRWRDMPKVVFSSTISTVDGTSDWSPATQSPR